MIFCLKIKFIVIYIYWGYDESILNFEQCIERIEEKWENGIENFEEEIKYIKDNIKEIIKKKKEGNIKRIPIEIYNKILHELPEERKVEWIININPEGKEDIIKSRRIESIGEINIDKMKEEEIKEIIEIITKDSEEKWIKKLNQRFEEFKNTIKKNESVLKETIEREERMKNEKEELERLLSNKEELVRHIKEEEERKRKIEEEERKRKEEEERRIEEEGRKQISQLSSGLNKEEQLFKSSEKGYKYAIKKLLKSGININAKDDDKRRRDMEKQH